MATATTQNAYSIPEMKFGPAEGQSVIDWLWDHPQNKDLVNQFLSNNFCGFCARGADVEVLPFYRRFAVQDYYYLMAQVKFQALRLNSIPDHDVEGIKHGAGSISDSAEFATEWLNTCTKELGITEDQIKKTPRSAAELGYESYLHSNAHKVTWFGLHVITIPCYYGWHKLAEKLESHLDTKKDTKFYATFIKPNITDYYANRLSGKLTILIPVESKDKAV
ncbi:hypothetical protein V8C35DRAFT_273563 [Trichoderma chlorosporum]